MGNLMAVNMAVIKPICQPQLYRSSRKTASVKVAVMVNNGNSKEISDRILLRLQALGQSATAVSQKAGLSKDGIRNILRNPESIPRGKTLIALAKELETTPQYLLTGDETQFSLPIQGLPYAGVVEAGAFRPVDMLDQDSDGRIIDLPRDPRFPKARQYAYEIRGDSMVEVNFLEGMWATAIDFSDFIDARGRLRDGSAIVVSRTRTGTDERELTVKEIRFMDGRTELHPRSPNKKHQVQVFAPSHLVDSAFTIEILAVVANVSWLMKI